MSYFCQDSYHLLLQNAKAVNHDYLEIIREAGQDCLQYVQTVCQGENLLNTVDGYDREMVGDYDQKRHSAHEKAIGSVTLLNRIASSQGIDPVFTGDAADRHQVADFCIELTEWLFRDRRRVL